MFTLLSIIIVVSSIRIIRRVPYITYLTREPNYPLSVLCVCMYVCVCCVQLQKFYEVFYYVHWACFVPFVISTAVHGSGGWIGFPRFWTFLLIPFSVYFVEACYRLIRLIYTLHTCNHT